MTPEELTEHMQRRVETLIADALASPSKPFDETWMERLSRVAEEAGYDVLRLTDEDRQRGEVRLQPRPKPITVTFTITREPT